MLIILPDWTMELEKKLDKVIKDIVVKNHIDLGMVDDSRSIERAKEMISRSLVRLYENYGVEDRRRFEEDEKEIKKAEEKSK